jgi:hypothetical protein
VFILENYFASKSSAVGRDAFSNAYPDKEVPVLNEAKVRELVTFRDAGSVCDRKRPTLDSVDRYKAVVSSS